MRRMQTILSDRGHRARSLHKMTITTQPSFGPIRKSHAMDRCSPQTSKCRVFAVHKGKLNHLSEGCKMVSRIQPGCPLMFRGQGVPPCRPIRRGGCAESAVTYISHKGATCGYIFILINGCGHNGVNFSPSPSFQVTSTDRA